MVSWFFLSTLLANGGVESKELEDLTQIIGDLDRKDNWEI
jgi:hypothetical protein